MELIGTALLALVQGVTEFLPISSSAHLILGRALLEALGIDYAGTSAAEQLAMDVALHVGSLGAVILYFWRDVLLVLSGLWDGVRGKGGEKFHLVLVLLVASLPIVVVAFMAKDFVTDYGRSIPIIAWTTLIFGVVLWFADRRPSATSEIETIGFRQAIVVGIAQCIAIIPGVSRSGICATAGRFVGLDRPLSARFATLLSIPTILGAGLLAFLDLRDIDNARLSGDAIFGGVVSFIASYGAIFLLMAWLRRQTYTPFVVYRVVLGALLLGLLYAGLV